MVARADAPGRADATFITNLPTLRTFTNTTPHQYQQNVGKDRKSAADMQIYIFQKELFYKPNGRE